MTDRPITFSGEMVTAILDGRKTQTRRAIKYVPDAPAMDNIAWPNRKLHPAPYLDAYCGARRTPENPRGMTAHWAYWTRDDRPGPPFKVGYVPGDLLWVREAWKAWAKFDDRLQKAHDSADEFRPMRGRLEAFAKEYGLTIPDLPPKDGAE